MSLEGKSQAEVAALASLSESLLSDSRTRGSFQRMVKAVNPKVVLPEVELEDRVAAVVKPLAEQNQRLQEERAQDKMRESANALFEELRDDRVIGTRSEFNELVKYAAGNGFQTNAVGLKNAARHKAAEAEVAEPTPSSLGLDNLKPGKGDEDLMKNPTGWSRNMANQALADLAKARAGR